MRGVNDLPEKALEPHERAFAEQNIGLLHKFMRYYGLPPDYYGRLAILYTRTAARYLHEIELQRLSFSTVVWLRLRTELSNSFREQLREPEIVPLDEAHMPFAYHDEHYDLLLEAVESKLTKRQRQVFRLRLNGKSNVEIAEECGISKKAVEHLFARIRKRVGSFFIDTS